MTVRAHLFNIVLVVSIVLWGGSCMPLMLGPRSWSSWVVRCWAKFLMWAMRVVGGLDLKIEGTLPKGNVIVAAKHQSAWDTFVFFALFHEPAYVMKQELVKIPFYGWFSKRSGHIPIDRSGKASALKGMVAAAKVALSDNRPIMIFPQGTRVLPGEPAPYQPGTAALYKSLGVPVIPVGLNSGLFWGQHGLMQRGGTVTLVFGDPIPPGLDRNTFMARLETEIDGLSDPLLISTKEEQN